VSLGRTLNAEELAHRALVACGFYGDQAARAELIAEYLATHPADDSKRQHIEALLELARQRREQEQA
jgi:hypothetical protein